MATEIVDKPRRQSPAPNNSQRMREVMEQGKNRLEEEREQRLKLLAEEKERQSQLPDWHQDKKEPFEPHKAITALFHPSDKESLQRFLNDKQLVESYELEYYLDHPEFTTIFEFTNWANSQY